MARSQRILELGDVYLQRLEDQHQAEIEAAVAVAVAKAREECQAATTQALKEANQAAKEMREHALASLRQQHAEEIWRLNESHQSNLREKIAETKDSEQVTTDHLIRKVRAECAEAEKRAVRLAVLEARNETWRKADLKERAAIQQALAEAEEIKRQQLCAADERAAEREAALLDEIQELQKLLAAERSLSASLRNDVSKISDKLAQLEKKHRELIEDYRETLTLLPGYSADNSWIL